MRKIFCFLAFLIYFFGFSALAQEGGSAANRLGQTLRIGQKTGIHLMYSTATPFVLEIPGEVWAMGFSSGSGKYDYSYSDYNSSTATTSTKSQSINFSLSELNFRFYIGNSFNIPFGYANYKISYPDWVYSGVTYDIDYSITQLNYGLGNEWTYDWGGYLGIDWYQGGNILSEEISVKHKSGTETSTTLAKAKETSTEIKPFSGTFIVTFGFGFGWGEGE
tara:strand:+ start:245 stop:904 length:660 start_codon:yes stop_codon:yes gene_type:complete